MAKVIIVDEKNNIIGHKDRDKITANDIYRVSSLWITNSNGDVLLAQRALNKSHDPGKWGPAVAGTLEEGETYESNLMKEAKEELGLINIKPILGPLNFVQRQHQYFRQRFFLTLNLPITTLKLQPSEVMAVRWFSKPELKEALKTHPEMFLSSIADYLAGIF